MGADQHIDWAAEAASALDWWRDAGVDVLVEDGPRDWLAPPAPIAPTIPPAAPVDAMPASLAAFLEWRVAGDLPDARWSGVTVSAEGPETAALMILADCPERDDGGRLFGESPAGRLFDRMLAAIGVARADVHLAAVCTRRPIAGKVPREALARLGEVARHHVSLVRPQRLLLLGDGAAQAVLGCPRAEATGRSHFVDHDAGKARVVATYPPRALLERPACKAESWKDLRLLMRESEDE